SVERIILPDTATLTCYMVKRLTRLVANWEVDTARMQANLDLTRGAIFSQSVLLALVESGFSRDDAYRLVQSAAKRSAETGGHMREVLAGTAEVSAKLSNNHLDTAFDVRRVLTHVGRVVDALGELD
ncbi:MAG: adenylosuccinate lyase, partial [Actinomycetota bacterium]